MSREIKFGVIGLSILGMIVLSLLAGLPFYHVFSQHMSGRAKLAEAQHSRQIAVEEARAARESATLLADAEIERAKGVAEANRIIGDSLQGNEAYLRYLWIIGLQDANGETIYIPTEAGLPILEAGKAVK